MLVCQPPAVAGLDAHLRHRERRHTPGRDQVHRRLNHPRDGFLPALFLRTWGCGAHGQSRSRVGKSPEARGAGGRPVAGARAAGSPSAGCRPGSSHCRQAGGGPDLLPHLCTASSASLRNASAMSRIMSMLKTWCGGLFGASRATGPSRVSWTRSFRVSDTGGTPVGVQGGGGTVGPEPVAAAADAATAQGGCPMAAGTRFRAPSPPAPGREVERVFVGEAAGAMRLAGNRRTGAYRVIGRDPVRIPVPRSAWGP